MFQLKWDLFSSSVQVASRSLVCSGSLEIPERDPTAESAMEDVRTAVLGLLEILQVHTHVDMENEQLSEEEQME